MASELHGATSYKLSIRVDQTLAACPPPSYAVAGDTFFHIHLYYKHMLSNSNHSNLPPQQLYSFEYMFVVHSKKFFTNSPKIVRDLLSVNVGLRYLPDLNAVTSFAPEISRFAPTVVPLNWMAVVPIRMTVTADTSLINLSDNFYRARRFYSHDIFRTSPVIKSTSPDSAFYLKALKVATADEARDNKCSICLEDFVAPNKDCSVVKMPCLHVYHEECIVQWLKKRRICPLCRQAMPKSLA